MRVTGHHPREGKFRDDLRLALATAKLPAMFVQTVLLDLAQALALDDP